LDQLSFTDVTYRYASLIPFRPERVPILRGFSWRVPSGRTVVLGPNGAGKTTLLSLAATLLRPHAGSVTYKGHDSRRAPDRALLRRAIGWMPQATRAMPGLTAREQVAYAGWLKGMSRPAAWQAAMHSLDRVGLASESDRLTSQLSGGQQRRVGLAQCLVHASELLILDEPSVGLDPGQRGRFREILAEVGAKSTILVSTHMVDDLADLFDTVMVLDRGEVRFSGSVAGFMDLAPSRSDRAAESAYKSLIRSDA
jgi:ABC-2 type transport system ATP-binding protein